MSSPDHAPTTSACASAGVTSTFVMRACAYGLRTIAEIDHPGDVHVVHPLRLPLEKLAVLFSLDRHADRSADFDLRRSAHPRHRPDRVDDVLVAGAAADVALERVADLVLARARILGEQAHRREHHPARAVAALKRVMRVEALLQRMERAVLGQPLDRRDLVPVRLDAEQRARLHRFAVEQHGAGTARRGVAADDRSGQVESLTQDVDEQLPRVELELVRDSLTVSDTCLTAASFHAPGGAAAASGRA